MVEVTATDGNNETAVQTIRVSVRDLSEPAPVLTGPSGGAGAASSAISVNENQTAVTTLAADNAVTWVITGGADAGEFRINPATGEISFVTAPDFEAPSDANGDNVYLVEVTATDANNETAVQAVAVTVLDISEAAPVLTVPGTSTGAGAASISVDENQTAVMTLTADRTVVWCITGGSDVGQFAINPSTGVVTFVSAPDFETPTDADTNNVYLVQVSATDANRETAVVVISVTVRDVAEPLPVLTGPSGGTGAAASAISVNENQTGVTVMSADKPVVWAIGRGVDAAKFAIDAASGALTFVAAPDYEAPTDADTNNVWQSRRLQ
ncbi:cadherin repeat domain-containing protein [Brevundimonas pishanensis]|uniref:cadherin repeat domain-containing protein n=1 Tax=Brevundimonas pishanensis TaxID=2896315 RepID=UPI001FA77450|nr:cadherin repeat domain-containing protein [Brevundimonas pishanensis]